MSLIQGNVRRVNNTDVKNILTQTFGENCKIFVSNREYYILDGKKVAEFIKTDQTDRLKNRSPNNIYDFPRILLGRALESVLEKGNNIGITMGEIRGYISIDGIQKASMSSYVVFIITHKAGQRVFLVDPKTDQCFMPNQKSMYEVIFI